MFGCLGDCLLDELGLPCGAPAERVEDPAVPEPDDQ